jgi:DNA-binding HxlR family transcriptional regulator
MFEPIETSTPTEEPTTSLRGEKVAALATVLDLIRFGRARTRVELSRRSGLGRAMLAQCLSELVERGLVDEGGAAESTGGRPAC